MFKVWSLGRRFQGLKFRVEGLVFSVKDLLFRVYRVEG